jgi:hypothetical protein
VWAIRIATGSLSDFRTAIADDKKGCYPIGVFVEVRKALRIPFVRRLEKFQIGELLEIGTVVSKEFRHAVGEHCRYDLPIEYVWALHFVSPEQRQQAARNVL